MISNRAESLVDQALEVGVAESLSVAIFDFKKDKSTIIKRGPHEVFDLASLTKPLTLGSCLMSNRELRANPTLKSLCEHRGGLPSWGRLHCDSWKQQILDYEVKPLSETLYSDFSALRAMLEIQKLDRHIWRSSLNELSNYNIDFWTNLSSQMKRKCAPTGFRKKIIQGDVHDDNAFVLQEPCSHAGLFSTIEDLLSYLKVFFSHHSEVLAQEVTSRKDKRFCSSFDTPSIKKSLAGDNAPTTVLGHLGFTGTCFWIDVITLKGCIILSNAVRQSWFGRRELNNLRVAIGNATWKS